MVCSRGCGANDAIDSITIQPFVYYLHSSVKGRGLCTAVNINFVQRTVVYTLASAVIINIIVFSFGAGAANSTLLLHVYGQSMTGAMTELFLFP